MVKREGSKSIGNMIVIAAVIIGLVVLAYIEFPYMLKILGI